MKIYGPYFLGTGQIGCAFWLVGEDLCTSVARISVGFEEDYAFVGTIVVNEPYQRRGLSSALHDAAFAWAVSTGRLFYSGIVAAPENWAYWRKLVKAGEAVETPQAEFPFRRILMRSMARGVQSDAVVKLKDDEQRRVPDDRLQELELMMLFPQNCADYGAEIATSEERQSELLRICAELREYRAEAKERVGASKEEP